MKYFFILGFLGFLGFFGSAEAACPCANGDGANDANCAPTYIHKENHYCSGNVIDYIDFGGVSPDTEAGAVAAGKTLCSLGFGTYYSYYENEARQKSYSVRCFDTHCTNPHYNNQYYDAYTYTAPASTAPKCGGCNEGFVLTADDQCVAKPRFTTRAALKDAVDACLSSSSNVGNCCAPNNSTNPAPSTIVAGTSANNGTCNNDDTYTHLQRWNVSAVTDMHEMFRSAQDFNQDINGWDVSNVTDMHKMFQEAVDFNQSLNAWDVSAVTDMHEMFYGADDFNQPLNNWVVSNVTTMEMMFYGADDFNQPLNNWVVSSVTNMYGMFYGASYFNQPLNNWDVSSVTTMEMMFGATEFNGDINAWDVSSVTSMQMMFRLASNFNQSLNAWDVSAVTNMHGMFREADDFNQDLNAWDVSNVTNMEKMFYGASYFNQPLNAWDVSSVTTMFDMFQNAYEFTHVLCGPSWVLSTAEGKASMFSHGGSIASSENICCPDTTPKWNGTACVACNLGFVGSTCEDCAVGYSGENCTANACTVSLDPLKDGSDGVFYCVYASAIRGTSGNCECDCGDSYTGTNCNLTKPKFTTKAALEDAVDACLSSSNVGNCCAPNDSTNPAPSTIVAGTSANDGTCANDYVHLQQWDVSSVTNMHSMFANSDYFNQDLSAWDVSNVTTMEKMFYGASYFNQPLNNWDVSKVKDMYAMFYYARNFNQDLSTWDVSSVTSLRGMFEFTKKFNQDLSAWDVSKVTRMINMFRRAEEFTQVLCGPSWVLSTADKDNMFSHGGSIASSENICCPDTKPKLEGTACEACPAASNWNTTHCVDQCGVENGDDSCVDACGVPNGDDSTCLHIDDCASNPCAHGTCIDRIGAYSCDCGDTGFTGTNCDKCVEGKGHNTTSGKCEVCPEGYVNVMSFHGALCVPLSCEEGYAYTSGVWDPTDTSVTSGNCIECTIHTLPPPGGQGQCVDCGWRTVPNSDRSQCVPGPYFEPADHVELRNALRHSSCCTSSYKKYIFNSGASNQFIKYDLYYNKDCESNGTHISRWNTSKVTNFDRMFSPRDPITGGWDACFYRFDADISNWDVSNAKIMDKTFYMALDFRQDISQWDVSSVTSMNQMFNYAYDFHGDISTWNVSSVTDFRWMFYKANTFQGNLSRWDVSSGRKFQGMFERSNFNGDISTWDVSQAENMQKMFYINSYFQGDLSQWDVSSVIDFSNMFYYATNFNSNISTWDVSSGKTFKYMFYYARLFDQDLSPWKLNNSALNSGTWGYGMFAHTAALNYDVRSTWNSRGVDTSSVSYMYLYSCITDPKCGTCNKRHGRYSNSVRLDPKVHYYYGRYRKINGSPYLMTTRKVTIHTSVSCAGKMKRGNYNNINCRSADCAQYNSLCCVEACHTITTQEQCKSHDTSCWWHKDEGINGLCKSGHGNKKMVLMTDRVASNNEYWLNTDEAISKVFDSPTFAECQTIKTSYATNCSCPA